MNTCTKRDHCSMLINESIGFTKYMINGQNENSIVIQIVIADTKERLKSVLSGKCNTLKCFSDK